MPLLPLVQQSCRVGLYLWWNTLKPFSFSLHFEGVSRELTNSIAGNLKGVERAGCRYEPDTPTLDVTAQGGATGKTSDIHWPMPVRLSEGGLMSYAYVGDVLLPASLTLKGTGGTTLHAHAEWLVCAEVCIPESGDFSLTLPASSAAV